MHRLYNSRRRCLDRKCRNTPNCYYPHRLTHFPLITAPTPFFIIFPQAIIVCSGNMAMCRRPSCVWCQRDGFSYDKCRQSLTVQLSLAKPFTFLLSFNLQDIFRPGWLILPIFRFHYHRPAFQDFYRMPLADGDVQGDAVGAWGEVE